MRYSRHLIPIIIVIFCVLIRLPQLFSDALFLDSDECVVALMAKHMMKGEQFPLFFWGQTYGFSLVEELFIVPFIAVLGVKTIAVKLAMLALWSVGVVFFYKALLAIDERNKKLALLLTLVLIAFPAWAIWSMKARGGYLTAFTLSSVTLYLIFNKKTAGRTITYFITAVFLYLIYESQLFWLGGLLPLVAWKLWQDKRLLRAALIPLVMLVLWFLFSLYKKDLHIAYEVNTADLTWTALKANVQRFPEFLYVSMHGHYHFFWAYDPGILCGILAMIATGIVFLLFTTGMLHLFTTPQKSFFFICALAFIPITFAYSLFSDGMQYRYLLPVSGYALIALYIYLREYELTKLVNIQFYILIVAGVLGMFSFRKSQYQRVNGAELLKAIKYFKDNDIKYVYAADYTFHWDLMFNSNEEVLSRNFRFPGRYPAYDTAIDRAYFRGEKTAIFGPTDNRFNLQFNHFEMEGTYYISVTPPKSEIAKAFEFLPEANR